MMTALIKILDYSCSQDRDKLKLEWTYKFVEELKVCRQFHFHFDCILSLSLYTFTFTVYFHFHCILSL